MVTAAHRDKAGVRIRWPTVAATAPVPADGGYWVAPTLFTDSTPEMAIARDEVFGPVTAVLSFADEDEAVDLANDTPYGLLAAVYTADHPRALRVARRIDAGVVLLNNFNRALLGTPFGGFKDSGYGREHPSRACSSSPGSKNIHELSERDRTRSGKARPRRPGSHRPITPAGLAGMMRR